MVIALPFIAISVFPLVANMDVKNISLAVVDSDHSTISGKMEAKVASSGYFNVTGHFGTGSEALRSVESGSADIILEIPPKFEENLIREKSAGVMISANAVNGVKGGLGAAYLTSVISDYNVDMVSERAGGIASSARAGKRLSVFPLFRFNPSLDYSRFMIPALMTMLLAMICGFLPALNIVGEKEKGTIEQLNVTPVGKLQFVLSKLIPYWVAGIISFMLSMLTAYLFYGMAPTGPIWVLILFSFVFILCFSGFGLVVSNYAANIQQAIFIMFFFVITMVFLSGLYTPFQNMPEWTQVIGRISPLKYYVQALRMLYLKGTGLSEMLVPLLLPLIGLALLFNTWALLGYRKKGS